MRETDLQYLACPRCAAELRIVSITDRNGALFETAELQCTGCAAGYPVTRGVPRFVPAENYAVSFGLQWRWHAKTQYDSYTGLKLSETRFFEETRWPRSLPGQVVLEVGSGAGRFTEQAATTGAVVVSMDYSAAVEANYELNGGKPNVLVVQGDIYQMPFRCGFFDKLFCFGMLQHTPDVQRSFMALPPMLKPGGELVADVYRKTLVSMLFGTKYYVRWLTRRMDPHRLRELTKRYIDFMWPLSERIGKIPRIGHSLNWRLLVADYGALGVNGELRKEWAYLDTFDMLAPQYDLPQTVRTMRRWFNEARLTDVDVGYYHNIILGRGRSARRDS
ncbi:MAG: methyltransferase domain-containing protein, partial [Gaiellaceae bacterium]